MIFPPLLRFWLIVFIPISPLPCVAGSFSAVAPQVWNCGHGGDLTSDLLARFDRDVMAHQPSLVIIMVGTNDFLNSKRSSSPEKYRADLELLISRVRSVEADLLLLTIPPCYPPYVFTRDEPAFFGEGGPNRKVDDANRILGEVAKKNQVPVVDIHAIFANEGQIGEENGSYLRNVANSRSTDGVHPTETGYRVIAQAIRREIKARHLPEDRIVCFGDSITYGAAMAGAGTAEGDSYPAQLKQLLVKNEQ